MANTFRERDQINISNPDEVKHWTAKLHCTEIELRAAVARVGPLVGDLTAFMDQEITIRG
jgi:hypothetical protein